MIDNIKKIGMEISESFPKSLVVKAPRKAKMMKEPLLIKLIFSIDEGKIKYEPIGLDEKRLVEYLWIGPAEGNLPQNRLTTDKLDNLINSNPKKRATYNILQNIRDFWREGEIVEKIPKTVTDLRDKLEKIEREFFEDHEKVRWLREELKKELHAQGLQEKIVLYTLCIEEAGEIEELAKTDGYEKFLWRVFLRPPHETLKGRCHVCGKEKDVLADPRFRGGSILKIYVTDKKGFTSGVVDEPEARLRTFSTCADCLRDMLAGENYIQKHLRDQLDADLSIYLIPGGIRFRDLDKMSKCIREVFGAVNGFEGLQEFERRMEREVEYKNLHEEFTSKNVHLDLIFGVRALSKFDFKYHIQDVPMLRLNLIREKMREIAEVASKFLGGTKESWYLGFKNIREIFPLRTQRGKVREWRILLELFSAIFNETHYPKHLLFKRATMLARIHRFGTHEIYRLRKPTDPDYQLIVDILKYNLLSKLLANVGVLSVESSERIKEEQIPLEVKSWWDEMNYDDTQKALFLLGYLVGRVGTEQFKKGDRKKAILNRINFDGMSVERVIRLANLMLKSLRDYRILPENEANYASMISLINKTREKMIDPNENLFYILSGYSFSTNMAITRGRGEDEK